jgi:hypothetical protein
MMGRLLKWASYCALCMMALASIGERGQAQALSASRDEISYKVRPGDKLIVLSRRFLVTPDAYRTVQRINGIKDANTLRVGSVLVIPTNLLRATRLDARVIAFKGIATATNGPRAAQVKLETRVSEGALVETGPDGFVTLQLHNGSKVSLPSNSRVRIAKMRTYGLTGGTDLDFLVERGRTETSATPLRDNHSRFRMRTPVAVSAVRGTIFRVGYDGPDSATLTEVVEGNVAVQMNVSSLQTSLPTGFGAAGLPSGTLQREQLLAPPGSAQRGRLVTFDLQPDRGAAGYHVQVAKDRDFLDIVAAKRSQTPRVILDSLPAGRYFVRAMAIAPSGLEGLPQVDQFDRRLAALRAQQVPGRGGRWRFDWDIGQSDKAVFRFQVFANGKTDVPVIDEPGLQTNAMEVQNLPAGRYLWRVGTIRTVNGKLEQDWTEAETVDVAK